MAHGLEGRVPFIDHKLAEFSFTASENLKLRGDECKMYPKKVNVKNPSKRNLNAQKAPVYKSCRGGYSKTLKDLAFKGTDKSEIYRNILKRTKLKK